ncbi:hypothetical protein LSTR_LSTR011195 [Laodelphax striatellus]|uniref:U-box domain-containing protein n=1 Tax=Laodelphax striatellus TaxID=195883 RepID=A0A482X3E1_LAOST|nr:hypothetical protein LSTR_LSTR011195 [Laodelphax striatellus]
MLIDFCNEGLVESIWCSVSESDGCSVKNLISLNYIEKQTGFRAERFIRPPVSIYIKFVEQISIDHVVLLSSNGAQVSSGIELFTGDTTLVDSFLCKAFLNNETGFIFHRFNKNNFKKSHENLLKQPFRTSRYVNVRYLKVNIIKTKNSTIPALKRIEVWGSLSNTCSEQIKNKILGIWLKIETPYSEPVSNKRRKTNVESQATDSNQSNVCEIIPEEFLDVITNELMEIPMVLPSGKIVDLKTLERYNAEQEKYGRSANDPFTGKIYTDISKPVYSSSLKLRIDEFLARNCDIEFLKHSSRTVGLPTGGAKVCRLVSKNTDSELYSNSSKLGSDYTTHIREDDTLTNGNQQPTFFNSTQNNSSASKEKSCSKLSISSFDSLKSDSLNESLKRFASKSTLKKHTDFERNSCSVCGTEDNLYRIPCKHHMCRSCITVELAKEGSKCLKCFTPFKSSDIVRTHSSTMTSSYRIT